MCRRPRNKIPVARDVLKPQVYDIEKVQQLLMENKEKQRFYHDEKAGHDLPLLYPRDPVRMKVAVSGRNNEWIPATVVSRHTSPRSYVVEHMGKKYRRNRQHLRLATYKANEKLIDPVSNDQHVSKLSPQNNSHFKIQLPGKELSTTNNKVPVPTVSDKTSDKQTSFIKPEVPKESTVLKPLPMIKTRSGRISKPPVRFGLISLCLDLNHYGA